MGSARRGGDDAQEHSQAVTSRQLIVSGSCLIDQRLYFRPAFGAVCIVEFRASSRTARRTIQYEHKGSTAKARQTGLNPYRSVTLASALGGKTRELSSAQPSYLTPATPAEGLELEAIDVGFASDSDLARRDLKGKAVFFYSTDFMSRHATINGGVIKKITDRGAAAIFVTLLIPGNLKFQFYPVGSTAPTFLDADGVENFLQTGYRHCLVFRPGLAQFCSKNARLEHRLCH